jgi:hypothetical protein
MLQYEGSDDMNGDQLEVMDNGDVIWAGQSQNVLRSGSWILFRIQGTTSRADQSTRPWDIQFQKAIGEYSGLPGTDPQSAEKEFSDAGILLTNDLDVTQGNKRALQRDYGAAYEAAKNGHHDGHAELVAEAIRSSQTEIVANGKTKTMIDPIALNTALRSISAIAAQGAAAG